MGSIEIGASDVLNIHRQLPNRGFLQALAYLGGVFAALYVIISIIMSFFRPWLLSLELVLAAPFKFKAKEEAIPGYDPRDLGMEQLERKALKTIKHRKLFTASISDRIEVMIDRLLFCCLRPSQRTNLILGGSEEVRKELDF